MPEEATFDLTQRNPENWSIQNWGFVTTSVLWRTLAHRLKKKDVKETGKLIRATNSQAHQ
jgi:hypothetical protein